MIAPNVLAGLSLFHGTAPSVVATLAARAIEVRFAPGATIFLAGSNPRGWFVVVEGSVRVVRGGGDRQHVIHTEGPGGTLGEVPLFTGGTHPATAIAAEPTVCALFDRTSLEAAIAECPEIAFVMTRRLALRVQRLVERLDERSARSVRARLIDFLLARAAAGRGNTISLGMTQQALAEELGTVREVVVRELRRLRGEKLIVALSGGRYRIPDPAALGHAAAS